MRVTVKAKVHLKTIKRTDSRLLENMKNHYSQPKGFVGRNICYAIMYGSRYYGAIVGGSATLHLKDRDRFFGIHDGDSITGLVNNVFYHIEPLDGYPKRNFTVLVLKMFRQTITDDWQAKYGDCVVGFESLVELPRTGEVYKRDGWCEVGLTKGYTCKRVAGKSSDSWSGRRVWNTVDLRPKRIFVRKVTV